MLGKKKDKKAKAEEKDEAASPEEGSEAGSKDGAEGETPEGGDLDLDGKKKKLNPLILIAGAVILLAGAGAGLYFSGVLDPILGKKDAEHAEGGEHAAESGDHGGGGHGKEGEGGPLANFMELPDLVVNLSTNQGQQRYLKLKVQLELQNAGDKAAVEAIAPRVIDHFQTYLRELRVSDLRGSAGIYRLRQELLARVNAAAAPVKVKDVLFQEILIQ